MRNWCYYFCRALSRVLLSPFVRLHIWRTPGAVEFPGAAVVAANHISHFDPILLSLAFRESIDWMTSAEFYSSPLTATLLRARSTPFPSIESERTTVPSGTAWKNCAPDESWECFPKADSARALLPFLEEPPRRVVRLDSRAWVMLRSFHALSLAPDRLYAWRSWRPGPPRTQIWIALGAPFSVAGASNDEADAHLVRALRELGAATIAHFGLSADDLPTTPQHRKGREAKPAA